MEEKQMQLEALLTESIDKSIFKKVDFNTFESLGKGNGTLIVLNLQDGVPCLREGKYLVVYFNSFIHMGGSAIEAGWGPIRFENTVKSFRKAIETAMQLLATRSDRS